LILVLFHGVAFDLAATRIIVFAFVLVFLSIAVLFVKGVLALRVASGTVVGALLPLLFLVMVSVVMVMEVVFHLLVIVGENGWDPTAPRRSRGRSRKPILFVRFVGGGSAQDIASVALSTVAMIHRRVGNPVVVVVVVVVVVTSGSTVIAVVATVAAVTSTKVFGVNVNIVWIVVVVVVVVVVALARVAVFAMLLFAAVNVAATTFFVVISRACVSIDFVPAATVPNIHLFARMVVAVAVMIVVAIAAAVAAAVAAGTSVAVVVAVAVAVARGDNRGNR